MTEISSLMQSPTLSQGLSRLQAGQNKLAEQAATGKKALSYEDLNQINSWAEQRRVQDQKLGFLSLNKSIFMRLESYGNQMDQLKDLAQDIDRLVAKKQSAMGRLVDIDEATIKNWLNRAYYILNSKDAFGHVFGGNNPLKIPMKANSLNALAQAPEPPTSLFTVSAAKASEKLMPQSPETIYGISSVDVGLNLIKGLQKLLIFTRGRLPQGVTGTPGKLEGFLKDNQKDLIHKVRGDLYNSIKDINTHIGKNVLLKKLLTKNQSTLSLELDKAKFESKKQEVDMVQLMKDIQEYKKKVEASSYALKALMNTDLINIMKD